MVRGPIGTANLPPTAEGLLLTVSSLFLMPAIGPHETQVLTNRHTELAAHRVDTGNRCGRGMARVILGPSA
jgi:hypothetical protein